ncbi:MAG: hypothetical protein HQL99_06115 [Magnetococcales bacterium]|nr:hypothetical protein [Magnetococcales bacterium]
MQLKILPQGWLDGACLLYAMVNASKSLLAPDLGLFAYVGRYRMHERWKRIISITPSPVNYLDRTGSGLTLKPGVEQQVTDAFFEHVFALLNTHRQRFRVRRISGSTFRNKSDYSSVVVFAVKQEAQTACFSGADHWMVAVGREADALFLACSGAHHFLPYQEERDPATGHLYNNSMAVAQLQHIYDEAIYQVEIIR